MVHISLHETTVVPQTDSLKPSVTPHLISVVLTRHLRRMKGRIRMIGTAAMVMVVAVK